MASRIGRPIRVGWLVDAFAPVDPDVAATVQASVEALQNLGIVVEPVRIPVLEQINALEVLWKLQVMETKPAFKKVTTGHEDKIFKHVQAVYDTPDNRAPQCDRAFGVAPRPRRTVQSVDVRGTVIRHLYFILLVWPATSSDLLKMIIGVAMPKRHAGKFRSSGNVACWRSRKPSATVPSFSAAAGTMMHDAPKVCSRAFQ